MKFQRGKIADVITGPRWRVKHHGVNAENGVFDIVGGEDEASAVDRVKAAHLRERIIVSVERLD